MRTISFPMLLVAVVLASLVGCASQPDRVAIESKAEITPDAAKLRLFGMNGNLVMLYRNSDCIGGGEKVQVSGEMGQMLSSLFGVVKNESIGMTETHNSKNVVDLGGFGHSAFYKEYALNPGKPVAIEMSFKEICGKYCFPKTFTFVPEQNAEYEGLVQVDFDKGACYYILKRISKNGEVMPFETHYASACH